MVSRYNDEIVEINSRYKDGQLNTIECNNNKVFLKKLYFKSSMTGKKIMNYYKDDIVDNSLNDVDLSILRTIQQNPGLNAKHITEKLRLQYSNITVDIVKNSLKRKLPKYVEFRGPLKTGGYFVIRVNTKPQ